MVAVFAPILAALALFLVFRFRVSSDWLVFGGAAVGAAYKLLLG
jgi:hypothetical protein